MNKPDLQEEINKYQKMRETKIEIHEDGRIIGYYKG